MSQSAEEAIGAVVSLWRYPVKSMMGEELNSAEVSERGLLGARAYALVDGSDGKVASAKNPRKRPQMFQYRQYRAAFVDPPGAAGRCLPSASPCRKARSSPATKRTFMRLSDVCSDVR
jgi:hypothetical protein